MNSVRERAEDGEAMKFSIFAVSRETSRRSVYALALAMVTVSCGYGEADWYGDVRFTDAQREQIIGGTNWLYTQGGLPPPRISWTHGLNEDSHNNVIRYGVANPYALGIAYRNGAIELTPDYKYLDGLTAHEMGHAVLDLKDDRNSTGIMGGYLYPPRWTEREEAQCKRCIR